MGFYLTGFLLGLAFLMKCGRGGYAYGGGSGAGSASAPAGAAHPCGCGGGSSEVTVAADIPLAPASAVRSPGRFVAGTIAQPSVPQARRQTGINPSFAMINNSLPF